MCTLSYLPFNPFNDFTFDIPSYVQHGMGIPSVSILLHEVIKLMHHAKVRDPIFFRIGTSGGIGIDGGNVIITEEALNADLKPYHELVSKVN